MQGGYVVYDLRIQGRTRFLHSWRAAAQDPTQEYFIHHARYSQLRSLHYQLKKYHTTEDLPEFPRKRILFMGLATSAIKSRVINLNRYFENLLKIEVIAQSEILLKFLSPEMSIRVTLVSSLKAMIEFMNLGNLHKIPPQISKLRNSIESVRRSSSGSCTQMDLSTFPPIDVCYNQKLHRIEFVDFYEIASVNESDLRRNQFDYILYIHSDQENLQELESVRMKMLSFSNRTFTLDASVKFEGEKDTRNQLNFLLQEMINMRSYNKL